MQGDGILKGGATLLEVLQTLATPVAIIGVGFFNYRLVNNGLKQMRDASEARMKRDDQRHQEVMAALKGNHEASMAALHELIARTGLTSSAH